MERMNAAFYYPGRDMKVRMRMELVDRSRRELLRVMTLLRRNNAEGPDQKYLIYFEKPGDVRRTSCMVWKHAHKEDDRWIYVRAVDRVRRVIAPEQARRLRQEFPARGPSMRVGGGSRRASAKEPRAAYS